MSKITNDDLTWYGTGCFIAVPMVTVGVKKLCQKQTVSEMKRCEVGINADMKKYLYCCCCRSSARTSRLASLSSRFLVHITPASIKATTLPKLSTFQQLTGYDTVSHLRATVYR